MFREKSKEMLTEEVLSRGAEEFAIDPSSLELIGGFENIIYAGQRGEEPVVLRITHHCHRTAEELAFELHWISYLKKHGADVAGAHFSRRGNYVESVLCQGTWLHFCCFEKARGKHIEIKQELGNTELFRVWGRAAGRLHRITRGYSPPPNLPRRQDNIEVFWEVLAPFLPADEHMTSRVAALAREIQGLSKASTWYGLMHYDLHQSNFVFDGQTVTLFDFDDCCYYQLAADAAIALYYAVWGSRLQGEAKDEFGQIFLRHWLEGYLSEHSMAREQLDTLPLLMLFRDCELYALLRDEFDLANLSPGEADLLAAMETRIRENRPIVRIDYSKLWQDLAGSH